MFLRIISKSISYLVFIVLHAIVVSSQNSSITIPLDKPITSLNKELYGNFFTINRTSTLQVNFSAVNKKVSFIIFQVHSHLLNVTLYNNTYTKTSSAVGTNVGLYSLVKNLDTLYVFNHNLENDLQLYLSVHGYNTKDPIPGGCNMEFPIPTSPFLVTSYNREYILVDGASAKGPTDKSCNAVKDLDVKFYRLYLPERDFSSETYFEGIRSMMSLDDILKNGEVIPETGVMWSMRRMLSAYPGTGSVYVAVVSTQTGYGVYVPSFTYACDGNNEDDACGLLDDVLSQLIFAVILFVGIFVCYFGHRFFKTEMFLIGLASGALITYMLIASVADLDRPALVGASILSGVFFGAIWLLFWWFYGIPVFAVLLSTLNLGFLVAAVAYYGIPGGSPILEQDFNFWTLFIFIVILTSVTMISLTFLSNMLCCSILGAYAIIYPIDFYLGSNLKYIIINAVRRAVVPKFNHAVVSPPFEITDAMLTVLWVGLSLSGFLFQHYHNRGRPPFPPPPRESLWVEDPLSTHLDRNLQGINRSFVQYAVPRSSRPATNNERTPLLA